MCSHTCGVLRFTESRRESTFYPTHPSQTPQLLEDRDWLSLLLLWRGLLPLPPPSGKMGTEAMIPAGTQWGRECTVGSGIERVERFMA